MDQAILDEITLLAAEVSIYAAQKTAQEMLLFTTLSGLVLNRRKQQRMVLLIAMLSALKDYYG